MIDLDAPLCFFNGERALKSVMSRNIKLSVHFDSKYNKRFKVVNEYYLYRKNRVELINITNVLSCFPLINF